MNHLSEKLTLSHKSTLQHIENAEKIYLISLCNGNLKMAETTNKEVYLVRGMKNETYAVFKSRVSGIVSELQFKAKPEAIKFTLTEKAPPTFSIIPFSKKKVAAISVYGPQAGTIEWMKTVEGFEGGYSVTEALPVAYVKNWEDGLATPGVCLFTLLRQKKGIDYPAFIHRWHHIHTPHSLIIHPIWHYVRNVVTEKLYADSPWWDGIVEEQVRTEADLLNPFRFWGNPLVILPRMIKELIDTKSFIDYPSMEAYLAMEYVVKSPART